MPFDLDVAAPADTLLVSAYPANARTHRNTIRGMYEVEHHEGSGRHQFGVGSEAVRDAILDWEDGGIWLFDDIDGAGADIWQHRQVGTFENVFGYASGNTANRPTNAPAGFVYADTQLGIVQVSDGVVPNGYTTVGEINVVSIPDLTAMVKLTGEELFGTGVDAIPIWNTIPWDVTIREDDAVMWDIGSPTRLVVPAGYTQARVTYSLHLRNISLITESVWSICRKNGLDFDGMPNDKQFASFAGTFNRRQTLHCRSGWLDVAANDYFEVLGASIIAGTRAEPNSLTWFSLDVRE